MERIPFHDLKRQYKQIKEEIQEAIIPVFETTAFAGGKFVELLETSLAAYNQTEYAICVNSGTSALHLALLALGIGSGDEVLLPANTFIATAWAVSYTGAKPVFVDCDKNSWNVSFEDIEKKISSKTKSIIGVHLYGQPFDIDPIVEIAKANNLYLVEDNAQALGALYKGKKTGSFSYISCTSFYPGKNLGAYGEGGAIFTNNNDYANHIKKLRNHGSSQRYYHDEVGFNMRMDGIQAAVLSVKLKYIDKWNNRRKEIATKYNSELKNNLILKQFQPDQTESVYHLYVVRVDNREKFIKYLSDSGIETGIHYPIPCHLQKAYKHLGYKKSDMPNSEDLAEHCVSLPMFPELENWEVEKVIEVVNEYKP